MTAQPKIRHSRLRKIGWTLWDPIGLGEPVSDKQRSSYADEYDSYLLRAAHLVRSGAPVADVVGYLVNIESEYMGLGIRADTRSRADAVVKAIADDGELWSQ